MTASDVAAWWGAALATLVFAWDIFKWKTSGARLGIKAGPNMQLAGDRSEKKHIFVEVVNRGDRPTTLTHLCVYQYASALGRYRRKRKASFFVPSPGGGAVLPHELGSGQRWTGLMDQATLVSHVSGASRYLHVGVSHSGSKKEVLIPFSLADL